MNFWLNKMINWLRKQQKQNWRIRQFFFILIKLTKIDAWQYLKMFHFFPKYMLDQAWTKHDQQSAMVKHRMEDKMV